MTAQSIYTCIKLYIHIHSSNHLMSVFFFLSLSPLSLSFSPSLSLPLSPSLSPRVNHSKNAIVKPQGKAPDVAQREVDEAMRKVRQASHSITNVIEPGEREGEAE